MFLAVDIGNTNITLGVFKRNRLLQKFAFECYKNSTEEYLEENIKNFLSDKKINECAVSSVVDEITDIVCEIIERICDINPIKINFQSKLGLKIKSEHPEKIGVDRITNACAVKNIYVSKPAIVVDIGTATTFDIIDKNGDFIGGLIMPGINTQLKSLAENTSKLPAAEISKSNNLDSTINNDTKKAILSGVIKGHAHAIEGLIEDCKKELHDNPIVVATGGNAELLSKYIKKNLFDDINPELTLEGLSILSKLNN